MIKNVPTTQDILYDLTQQEDGYYWKSEEIFYPKQSNNLQNTYAAFKSCSNEEVMNMTKLAITWC